MSSEGKEIASAEPACSKRSRFPRVRPGSAHALRCTVPEREPLPRSSFSSKDGRFIHGRHCRKTRGN